MPQIRREAAGKPPHITTLPIEPITSAPSRAIPPAAPIASLMLYTGPTFVADVEDVAHFRCGCGRRYSLEADLRWWEPRQVASTEAAVYFVDEEAADG